MDRIMFQYTSVSTGESWASEPMPCLITLAKPSRTTDMSIWTYELLWLTIWRCVRLVWTQRRVEGPKLVVILCLMDIYLQNNELQILPAYLLLPYVMFFLITWTSVFFLFHVLIITELSNWFIYEGIYICYGMILAVPLFKFRLECLVVMPYCFAVFASTCASFCVLCACVLRHQPW